MNNTQPVATSSTIERLFAMGMVLAAAAWLGLVAWLVAHVHTLPDNDYWYVIPKLVQPNGAIQWSVLMERMNEHLTVIPKLMYWLVVRFAHGSNRVLAWIAFGMATAQAGLLWRMAPSAMRKEPAARAALALFIVAASFPFSGAHNFMMGMSGVAWFSANLCAVAALLLASGDRWLAASLVAFAGSFSYGTGLGIWPALLVMAALRRTSWRGWCAILVPAMLALAFFAISHHTPGHHPHPEYNPLVVLEALCTLIGSAMARGEAAMLLGCAGLVIGAMATFHALEREEARALSAWIALALYALANLGLMAVSRAGFGEGMLQSSRYASIPALFWLAVMVSAYPSWRAVGWRWSALLVVALMAVGTTPVIAHYRKAQLRKQVFAEAIVRGMDATALHQAPANITPFKQQYAYYRKLGHVPFHEKPTPVPQARVVADSTDTNLHGCLEQIQRLDEQGVQLTGWAVHRHRPIRDIVILDARHSPVGRGVLLDHRPDVDRYLKGLFDAPGWIAVAKGAPDGDYTACVRFTDDDRLYPLHTIKPSERGRR